MALSLRLFLSLHNGFLWAKLYTRLYAGDFGEARRTARRLAPRWRHVLAVSRDSAIYAEALSLHLQGDFEEALVVIRPVRARNRRVLEGASLVMLGRDLEHARELLHEACKVHRTPEDLLFLALAQQATDRHDEAKAPSDEAGRRGPIAGRMARVNLAIFHYLRALYRIRACGEGLTDLRAAAEGTPVTVYVMRARALLPSTEQEDDGRSSLAAITIDE